MATPWTRHRAGETTLNSSKQSLNFSSFADTSFSGRSRSSMAGQVLEETPYHRVESFGQTLPVQIREALAAKNVGTASEYTSVNLHDSGWAWLVCGRKLFVWRYFQSQNFKSLYCKEFQLPATELYNTAHLVTILPSSQPISAGGSVSIMMVSPEGVVRYWPNLAQDNNCIEMNLVLAGHTSHSLTAFQHEQLYGGILLTSANELLMIIPTKKSLEIHSLQASGGMFFNLGKRMSSFIFGSHSEDEKTVLRKVVVSDFVQEHSRMVYVLSGNQLAQWEILVTSPKTVQEKMTYQVDCESMFAKAASQALQVPLETIDQLTVWCLDVCSASDGIVILAAVALKGPSHTTFFYMFGTLQYSTEEPQSLSTVNVIQFSEQYSPSCEDQLLNYHLLLPKCTSTAYIYTANSIICVPAYKTDDVINKIDFNTPGDGILGSGVLENKGLFFSRKNGVINVTVSEDLLSHQNSFSLTKSRIPEVTQATLPDISLSHDLVDGQTSDDQASKFKEAFLLFCQQKIVEAQSICSKLFTTEDTSLDTTVASLSQDLIDDYPASDPRWAESIPIGGMSASSSLIILHQLEDKLKAHEFFVDFLKGVAIWNKVNSIKVREQMFPTPCLMCEHSEKLCAAIALCRLHKTHQSIVDASISLVMAKREHSLTKGLTETDLFFREVSRVEEILTAFLEYEEGLFQHTSSSTEHIDIITGVNSLMQEMLFDAWTFRQQNSSLFQSNNQQNNELVFWTATCGPCGIRNAMFKQLQITVQRGVMNTDDNKTRFVLYEQMVNLADLYLDGYLMQLESIRSVASKKDRYDEVYQKYEQDRRAVIYPLVEFNQFTQAASLAEKYQDFGILIELCEARDDKEMLEKYSEQFKLQGFSDYLFKWYMDKGERHKLMNQPVPQHDSLGKFLSSHHHLSWLHDIHTKSFYKAHETLKNLAKTEKTFLQRKKTLLSLSKLAVLAAEDDEISTIDEQQIQDELEFINNEQDVILHQETLPYDVLQNANINLDTMPPLPPSELIELYIGDKNSQSTEYDFKKSLDLLRHAESSGCETSYLKHRIWCKAILKDNWTAMKDVDPLVSARNTVFFKTVELAYNQGLDLKEIMPSMDSLLQSEDLKASGLSENPNFRYLLSAGYEQIERSSEDSSMVEG